jgi:hypothetical protein
MEVGPLPGQNKNYAVKATVIPGLVAIMARIVLMLNISADAMQPVRCPRRSGVWCGDAP